MQKVCLLALIFLSSCSSLPRSEMRAPNQVNDSSNNEDPRAKFTEIEKKRAQQKEKFEQSFKAEVTQKQWLELKSQVEKYLETSVADLAWAYEDPIQFQDEWGKTVRGVNQVAFVQTKLGVCKLSYTIFDHSYYEIGLVNSFLNRYQRPQSFRNNLPVQISSILVTCRGEDPSHDSFTEFTSSVYRQK